MGERVQLEDGKQIMTFAVVAPDLVEIFCNALFFVCCFGFDKEGRDAVDKEDDILVDGL
jgi:hypothetical protein